MSLQEEHNELLAKGYEIGYSYEKIFRGCSQCVLAGIMDVIGEPDDAVFRSATSLAGGIAVSSRGTCGALAAGVMAISHSHGRERGKFADVEQVRRKCHEMSRKLVNKFEGTYGSITCGDIQTKLMGRSFDLLDPTDYEEFEKAGAHEIHCPSVVGNAVKWTLEILLEEEAKRTR